VAKLKPYEEYREVDLPWVEKVPSHWEISYIKYLFNISRGRVIAKTELDDNGKYPVYSSQTENYGCLGYINTYDYEGDKITWTTDGENAGTVFLRRGKYNCTNICGVLTPISSENTMFIYHALRYIAAFYKRKDTNGYKIMSYEMAKIPIIIPPKKEQDQIAKFLDNRLSKISRFIKTKKKQVELLKEQKQAIINQAVTKGIDPNVPMKDSGVEWIGEIPEHWKVGKLSNISRIILSGLDKKSYDGQKQVKLCNYTDVYNNHYITNDMDFMIATAKENEIKNLSLSKGDIIITKDSESWDDIGVPAYVNKDLENVLCGYHLAIIKVNTIDVFKQFLFKSFLSNYVVYQFNIKAKGVTRYGISYQDIRDTLIIIPPFEEQEEIVSFITSQIRVIDKAIDAIQKQIDLVKEYRTSLISEVVTGKVDVRDIAVEDIEELEEEEEEVFEEEIEDEGV
jgi:type I restriction enzyme S subunit